MAPGLDATERPGRSLTVEITRADEDRAVVLVGSDVEVTLGLRHKSFIERQASWYRTFFNDPDSIDVTADEYFERVAEEVQQHFHDSFTDTSWPACPVHRRHPLWLHDGYWVCDELHKPVARLGELRASRDTAGAYVVFAP